MVVGKKPMNLSALTFVTMMVIAVLYLFNTFFIDAEEGFAFQLAADNAWIGTVFTILILGVAVYAMWQLGRKLGQPLNKKDVMGMVFIGLFAWFMWDMVLANILGMVPDFSAVAAKTAMKMGMVP